jgi:hypothetical protein
VLCATLFFFSFVLFPSNAPVFICAQIRRKRAAARLAELRSEEEKKEKARLERNRKKKELLEAVQAAN